MYNKIKRIVNDTRPVTFIVIYNNVLNYPLYKLAYKCSIILGLNSRNVQNTVLWNVIKTKYVWISIKYIIRWISIKCLVL